MKNLTTPHAILIGSAMIVIAIVSIPYSFLIIKPTIQLDYYEPLEISICGRDHSNGFKNYKCASVVSSDNQLSIKIND